MPYPLKHLVLVYEGTLCLDSPEESRRASVIHAEGLVIELIFFHVLNTSSIAIYIKLTRQATRMN
jgi:hypothetical protein